MARRRSKVAQQARRNARIETAPQRNQINQTQLGYQQDYLNALQGARSAYGGFENQIGNIPRFPLQHLGNELQGQLAQFHTMLGGSPTGPPEGIPTTAGPEGPGLPVGLPGAEQQAGTALYSQLGDNAFNTLTNDAARQASYQQSAAREGNLAERYARENLIQDLQDKLQGLAMERSNLASTMPGRIQQEMERLQQEAQSRRSDAALRDYLIGQANAGMRGGRHQGGHRRHHGHPGPQVPPGPGGQTGGITDTNAGGNNFVPPDINYTDPTNPTNPQYINPGPALDLAGQAIQWPWGF